MINKFTKLLSISSCIVLSSGLGLAAVSAQAYDCTGIPQYAAGTTYATGQKVVNHNEAYTCTVGGWCTIGGPYEPGVGWAWTNTWTDLGACGAVASSSKASSVASSVKSSSVSSVKSSSSSVIVSSSKSSVVVSSSKSSVPSSSPKSSSKSSSSVATGVGLDNPVKKEIAMELVSSAENSSLDWRAQFAYIEDIGDGRGYTAGIIGFCSGTGDMLELVNAYTQNYPGNGLAKYIGALSQVNNTSSHAGLDPNFTTDWKKEAKVAAFQTAQEKERDDVYFNPSVSIAKSDGIRALGQFAYYDAAVVHGYDGMLSVRARALKRAKTPAQGGNEVTYLNAFMDERVIEMNKEAAHEDTTRIDTAQRVFLNNGNLDLNTPLSWKVYGDSYNIP